MDAKNNKVIKYLHSLMGQECRRSAAVSALDKHEFPNDSSNEDNVDISAVSMLVDTWIRNNVKWCSDAACTKYLENTRTVKKTGALLYQLETIISKLNELQDVLEQYDIVYEDSPITINNSVAFLTSLVSRLKSVADDVDVPDSRTILISNTATTVVTAFTADTVEQLASKINTRAKMEGLQIKDLQIVSTETNKLSAIVTWQKLNDKSNDKRILHS